MTLFPLFPRERASFPFLGHRRIVAILTAITCLFVLQTCARFALAQGPAAAAPPDVLVLSNGDTLHGKLVNEIGGKVTFHSDPLGDISVGWDKIKELHAGESFAVVDKNLKLHGKGKQTAAQIPTGPLEVADKAITVHSENGAVSAPIPVADALYITDKAVLDKQLYHHPSFFTGWNGAATAGAAIVTATQDQYTFSGGV
ncbi:MAG TPA: hypothetical protein VL967_01305, partial [Terracidiphilus sp.]|nr:hypothetical protein [Terracidiphilus sp.]